MSMPTKSANPGFARKYQNPCMLEWVGLGEFQYGTNGRHNSTAQERDRSAIVRREKCENCGRDKGPGHKPKDQGFRDVYPSFAVPVPDCPERIECKSHPHTPLFISSSPVNAGLKAEIDENWPIGTEFNQKSTNSLHNTQFSRESEYVCVRYVTNCGEMVTVFGRPSSAVTGRPKVQPATQPTAFLTPEP